MSTQDLLFELGCEELPAGPLNGMAQALLTSVSEALSEAGFGHDPGQWFATPRRLAFRIPALAAQQPDRMEERRGPAVDRAFDAEGKPTRAAEGFARSLGLEVGQLDRLQNDDGEWLYVERTVPGQNLADVLPDILGTALRQLPTPRTMRWADHDFRFLRPVHWLVLLHGNKTIPCELLGVESGRTTRGHRVHATGPIELPDAAAYEQALLDGYVMADSQQRRERILNDIQDSARELQLTAAVSDELLDEINNLVEWPVAVCASFDPSFLEVPAEALVSSMETHQRFVALRSDDGNLSDRFVGIANLDSSQPDEVAAGYERVIRPRLADARFFWEQDQKKALSEQAGRLDDVLFQKVLGSIGEKCRRLAAVARELSDHFGVDAHRAEQAATLCKADLVTDMVGEFPDLQGTMGKYLARTEGLDEALAVALESHYQPRHASDQLPDDALGQLLALADRADTIVGIFAAGQAPTGNKDPFALRRAAVGMVRMLRDLPDALDLDLLLDAAAASLKDTLEVSAETLDEARNFILERHRQLLKDTGVSTNRYRAVSALGVTDLQDFDQRVAALQQFSERPEAAALAAADKRSRNILRKADLQEAIEVQRGLLEDDAEKALLDALDATASGLQESLDERDYKQALSLLASLAQPLEAFFDEVMVMADDPALQRNRLAILQRLRLQMGSVADLSCLDD